MVDCGFTVVVDSNEGLPYRFDRIRGDKKEGYELMRVPVERRRLKVGDYTVKGLVGKFTVERKSENDIMICLLSDRDRLHRQATAMQRLRYGGIFVIEMPMRDIERATKAGIRTIFSWGVKYWKVGWLFFEGRDHAEKSCYQLLRFAKEKLR